MAEAPKRRDKEEATPKWDNVRAQFQKRLVDTHNGFDDGRPRWSRRVFCGVGKLPK
jgi:hypothetical protein